MGIAQRGFLDLYPRPQRLEAKSLFGAVRADPVQRQLVTPQHDTFMPAPAGIAGAERPPQQRDIGRHERQDRPRPQREEAQSADEEYHPDRADQPWHMAPVEGPVGGENQVERG